jgi:uncharacterized sodium:solute symporter family permease YidK
VVGIVIVAFTFVPRFLCAGIHTMPEYLEYRYSPAARALMSVSTVLVYVLVTTAAVLYSGATALATVFGVRMDIAVDGTCGRPLRAQTQLDATLNPHEGEARPHRRHRLSGV